MRAFLLLTAFLLALPVAFADEPAKKKEAPLTKGLRYASLTPDGKVVFCYRGDVWVMPADGKGHADRLTIHEEQDTISRVSPDGKRVAFSSKRHGNYDIFVVPIEGGMPEQITFHSGVEIVCDWSPDGKKILFSSNRDPDRGGLDLYEVDLEGGTPRRITRDGAREASYSPDGSRIVYARGFTSIYWDDYEGSANFDLYVVDTKGGLPRQLTDTEGNERWPFFSADGATIYFIAEEKGVANFYSMPVAGGARTQVTKYKKDDVQRPDLAWDYKTVVFERVGQLYTADLTAPKDEPDLIPVSIQSDVRNSGIVTRTITSGGEQVHVSRDGRTCVFALRGDIWMMPAGGGNARRITSGPDNDQWPRLSPDGKTIAYFSNKSGNNDIYLHDLRTGATQQVTRHRADDFFQNWSPDGSKLVFSSERSGNRDIWVLDLATNQATQLTRHPAADDDPCFSPDGSHIAFDSGRGGTQAIYVMQADGSGARQVTHGAGFFQVPSFSPDGRMLVYEGMSPTSGRSLGLFVVSVQGGPSMQISNDGSTAFWSPAGDYIYFTADRGPESGVFRVPAPTSIHAGERVAFIGRVQVDLKKELGELFDEAWAALRDGFYDAKMHKVDWKAMKRKYRDMAVDAENKDEFHNIVRQMLAELSASHLGIFGGHSSGTAVTPPAEESGYLGLEFEQAALDAGSWKVASVAPGSPADGVGLRVGDVVTKVGGKELKADTNLDQLLAGTVGKDVPVAYKPRSERGLGDERTAKLKPIGWGQLRQLNYENWTKECAERVEEATKSDDGKVGYIHLDQMNGPNLQKFQQAVAAWNKDKKILGMILDVRDNGGGNIHNQLIEILSAKPLAKVRMRGREMVTQPALYWDRPVTVLINERSFSDAEVFPHMFKAAGLGKVVGVPTAGGVIGTNNITLSDGSTFRVPRTGFWSMDGTNLEGLGVAPDYLVEETPEDRLTGRDPQLDKAIEVVLGEIAERKKQEQAEAKPGKQEERPQPGAEPETPQPAPGPENPLADVSAGEWVRYRARMPGQEEDTTLLVTVSGVADGSVQFDKKVESGGHDVPALPDQVQRAPVLEALAAFGEVTGHAREKHEIRGTEADVLRVDVRWPDGSTIAMFFTNAVPAYGLWKVEREEEVILEALEWGTTETVEPDAAKAADSGIPDSPMYDARIGEWLKLRSSRGGREFEQTVRVADVTDDEIVLAVSVSMGGETRDFPPVRRPRTKELRPPAPFEQADAYGRETITVDDREFDCITVTATDPGGAEVKWWYCPKLPVNGLVRMDRNGETMYEIVDWGEE